MSTSASTFFNDIETPVQMTDAILSCGGVNIVLCECVEVSGEPSAKLEGISQIRNVQFEERGLRVWRAYQLGPGTRFMKAPSIFRRISGDVILFVSSKRRCLEARNFAVILIFIPFTTYEKTSFTE